MLVPSSGWNLCHLATWNREAGEVSWPSEWPSQEYIQLNMETERDGHLPFLEFDIYGNLDGTLGHKVYWKPTHTKLYLQSRSYHHPTNIQAVFSTLVHTASSLWQGKPLGWVEAPNRCNRPSTQWLEPPSWKRSPPRLLFFCMSRQHMVGSAECWPNITLNMLDCT